MIVFFLVDGGDPADPADRTRWGAVEDGAVRESDDETLHPTSKMNFEEFVDYQKEKVEGVTDPVYLVRRFDMLPVVAAVPKRDGDGFLFAGDEHAFGEDGDLGPFERFEWEQYVNLDRIAASPDKRIDPRREHVVPDRFSVVRFAVAGGEGLEVIGRVDTATGEILDAPHGETYLEDVLDRRFLILDDTMDPVRLLVDTRGKTRKSVRVVDAETGDLIADPRHILPKPHHPDHADVDLLEDVPEA